MIKFRESHGLLILVYYPFDGEGLWLHEKLKEYGKARILRTFNVTNDIILDKPEFEIVSNDSEDSVYDKFEFIIGTIVCFNYISDEGLLREEQYYKIDRNVLGISFDLHLACSLELDQKIFVADRGISIFSRFNDFKLAKLIIGGTNPENFPEEAFRKMLDEFPTTTELKHYAMARISAIARNYLQIKDDFTAKYEKYLNKKISRKGSLPLKEVAPYE